MTGTGVTGPGGPEPNARAAPTIALDYTPAAGHAPGVGRYVRELVRALVRLEERAAVPLRLVEVGRGPRPMAGAPLGLEGPDVCSEVEHVRIALPRRMVAGLARVPGMPRAAITGSAALMHRVHPGWPPVGRTPHSIAVAEFPAAGSRADDSLGRTLSTAAGVLVFSRDAGSRVVSRYGIAAERVHRAPVGSEHWERSLRGEMPDRGPAPPTRTSHDVLVLGAVRASRRPLDVLRAFEALRSSGRAARLVLVGRRGDMAHAFGAALRASAWAADVRWIHEPDESRMPACVAGASVLLHLTEDEASPVTPLEATRMGLPVVATPLPAFREVLEGSARWVDGSDPSAVAAALREALDEARDPDRRDSLRELARPFTWSECARAHRAAWLSMLGARAERASPSPDRRTAQSPHD